MLIERSLADCPQAAATGQTGSGSVRDPFFASRLPGDG